MNGISSAKTVTKVNRINFTSVINKLDLGSIIYPRVITAEYIIKYVRSMNNSLNSNVEALYKLEDGKAEVLEFLLKENSDRKSTRLNSSHANESRMPSSA